MQEGNLLREMGAATRNRGPDGAEQARTKGSRLPLFGPSFLASQPYRNGIGSDDPENSSRKGIL